MSVSVEKILLTIEAEVFRIPVIVIYHELVKSDGAVFNVEMY